MRLLSRLLNICLPLDLALKLCRVYPSIGKHFLVIACGREMRRVILLRVDPLLFLVNREENRRCGV